MARTSTGNDSNLLFCKRVRAAENDLVLRVESKRWICKSERMESRKNQMGWIGEEMFGCVALVYLPMHIFWGFSFVCGADPSSCHDWWWV
jgi:hypothetical protein